MSRLRMSDSSWFSGNDEEFSQEDYEDSEKVVAERYSPEESGDGCSSRHQEGSEYEESSPVKVVNEDLSNLSLGHESGAQDESSSSSSSSSSLKVISADKTDLKSPKPA